MCRFTCSMFAVLLTLGCSNDDGSAPPTDVDGGPSVPGTDGAGDPPGVDSGPDTPPRPFDPVAAHDALLAEATGYFAEAGGNGGQGGDIYYITTLDDDGPGSMREALTRSEPLIILFEDGLNGQIDTVNEILVASNKTIWGRHRDGTAADIFIHPTDRESPFKIRNSAENIIIANLRGDAPGPNDSAPDFISIRDRGTVWVHHVTAIGDGTSNMDGFVDVHAPGVTLSWNRIEGWDNVHLVYPLGAPLATVTLHHNLFRASAGRMPKASRGPVNAHAYNNWLDDWGYDGMNGEGSESQVLTENNVFTPGSGTTRALRGSWGGSGNALLDGAEAENDPTSVFTPPYDYTLDPVGTTAEHEALRARLEAEAGWQSSF